MNSRPWLALSLGAALALWLVFLAVSYQIPFWYDEVFSLGAAGIGAPSADWPALTRDVHPPSYILLLRAASAFTEGPSAALRLVNALGLPILVLSALTLARALPRERALLAGLLLVANLLFFHTSLELRAYFLLYALAILGHALWLRRLQGAGGADLALFFTALALTSLHFFGAALGAALLALSALLAWREGRRPRAALMLAASLLMAALLFAWAFVISDISGALGGGLWIKNGWDAWIRFASANPLLCIAALALGLAALKGLRVQPLPLAPLAPGVLVLGAALLISLHSPTISTKNLITLLPGLALFAAMALPAPLLSALSATPLSLALTLAAASLSAWKAAERPQDIAAIARTALPAECAGVPLYTFRPDIVDTYAQALFTAPATRPLRHLPELRNGLPPGLYAGPCPIFAAGWHEPGTAALLMAFLAKAGISAEILGADGAPAAPETPLSPGFIIRALPPA